MAQPSLFILCVGLLCCSASTTEVNAQRYIIKVHTIQKFEHALGESISSAISKGLFAYKEGYRTRTTYIFDLDRRIMRVYEPHRPMAERPIGLARIDGSLPWGSEPAPPYWTGVAQTFRD